MNLEQGIRQRQLKPEPIGHFESPSKVYDGKALLDTSKTQVNISLEEIDERFKPDEIIIQVRWEPIPLDDLGTNMQFHLGGLPLEAGRIYDPGRSLRPEIAQYSRNRGITLVAQENIWLKWGERTQFLDKKLAQEYRLGVVQGESLFSHIYVHQTTNILTQTKRLNDQNQWFMIPPKRPTLAGVMVSGLFGYGVYAAPGVSIQNIQPVFGMVSYLDSNTMVQTSTLSRLLEVGISPPQPTTVKGNRFVFVDQFLDKDLLSLAGLIHQGYVQVQLADEEGTSVYRSVSYVQEDLMTQVFSITFRKGGDVNDDDI
jgi:hypothetical protein